MDKNINQPGSKYVFEFDEKENDFLILGPATRNEDGSTQRQHIVHLEDEGQAIRIVNALNAESSHSVPSTEAGLTAHTPGPWKFSKKFNRCYSLFNHDASVQIGEVRLQALACVVQNADEQALANAELIAKAPMMEKELQEAKAKLLKAWQTCTSLHIMLNKCQPYIADLQTDNIHDPSVGIRRDDDLQALADEMKHFVDVKSIDAYHESMSKELQEARAALQTIRKRYYDNSTIIGICDAVLSSPHDTQKL